MIAAVVRGGAALAAGAVALAVAGLIAADVPGPPAVPRVQVAPAQPVPTAAPEAGEAPSLFVTDRTAARRLRVAEERIAEGRFAEAVELLQSVLDADEDVTAPTSEEGDTFESVKRRALDLIGGLPADGGRIYEVKYGAGAKQELGEALARGDWDAVQAISRRFFHTAAGQEATFRLAVRAYDRGDALQAALLFDLLRTTPGAARRNEPSLALRAAVAWLEAGLRDSARRAAEAFLAGAGETPRVGEFAFEGVKGADELLARLERTAGRPSRSFDRSWAMLGGEAGRTGEASPVTVAGGAVWVREFNSPNAWDDPREAARAKRLVETLQVLEETVGRASPLTQPATHPVAAGDVAVFRTLRNVQAVDAATGRFLWQTERPHEAVFAKATNGNAMDQYGGVYSEAPPEAYVSQRAWRNVTAGALATDGRYVYGVEGTGVAARISPYTAGRVANTASRELGETYDALFAYDLAAEGAIAWTAGGPSESGAKSGVFFLGPPLPLGGLLYCLAEEDGEVRLVVLDPSAESGDRTVWSQALVTAEQPLLGEPVRRLSGVSPSFGEGVLVCPTSAGAVVGIDLGRRLLLWGYQYGRNVARPIPPRGNFGIAPEVSGTNDEEDRWLESMPKIAEGAVLLTPRDSDELHCLNLTDGRLRWKRPRGGALYVADVSGGRAVVVGRRGVEALDLKTGEAAWGRAVETPVPAGRGVRSGDLYHLPLSTGQVLTLRLSTGEELARSPAGEGVKLGNLIVADGRLVSQSEEMVVGFRRVEELEAEVQAKLARGGIEKAEALALRGEDRLHRGDQEGGVKDLRAATEAADLPRARRLLVGVLLEGLRNDFTGYRRYRDDLETLASDPDQRTEYLRRYADGLYRAGESRAAFEAYLRLAVDPVSRPAEERLNDELAARTDRVLRVRLAELYAGSSQEERRGMDAALARGLATAARTGDEQALLRFASCVRGTPVAGDALRALAERYRASGDRLRAEQVLMRLRAADPKASFDGASFAARPRGAVSLGEAVARFDVPYKAEYVPDQVHESRHTEVVTGMPVRVMGPVPAEYAGWQFELDVNGQLLHASDPVGVRRWSAPLGWEDEGPVIGTNPAQIRFCGHLAAFVSGTRLVVLDLLTDPAGPRVLWSRLLAERRLGDEINRLRFPRDPSGAAFGFAGAELLVFQVGTTVTAVDPVSGEELWQRGEVAASSEVAGDDEFVVLRSPDGTECRVLRTADGEEAVVRPTEPAMRLGWSGTRLVAWAKGEEGWRLGSVDVARGREVWGRDFAASATVSMIGSDEVAVLDRQQGVFTVVRASDGGTVFEGKVHPDLAIDRFLPLKSYGRYLLFTHRAEPRRAVQEEMDRTRFSAHGLAYAFDGEGKRLWSAAVRRQSLAPEQPAGLPVLYLATRLFRFGSDPSHRAAVLDVRTGQFLAEQNRGQPLQPFRTTGNVKDRSLEIATTGARFLLTPSEEPPGPPREDGLDALREPAEREGGAGVIPVNGR